MDSSQLLSEMTGPALMGLALLLVVIILAIIFKRVSGASGGKSRLDNAGGLNLIDLKKKGLLTPEEASRVGAVMARHIEKQARQSLPGNSVRADQLLLDPEVRRLEVLAAAAKQADGTASKAKVDLVEEDAVVHQAPLSANDKPLFDNDVDSVELPFDVQQLADSGLLSPEEIANVKRRILERNRQV